MKPTQRNRQLAITTALGEDVLVLNRMIVHERMSTPFEIEAELSATDANVPYNQIVGHPVTIRFDQGTHGPRYFNGYVSRIAQTANRGAFARYRATIVPWFWFLTRTSDCRVFQRKSVLDIADEVFNGHRFGSEFFEPRAQGPFPKRRYCVQYRETDFNFISRLLESEGIYYWFEHADGKHKLILADGIGQSKPAPGYETVDFHDLAAGAAPGREVITEWIVEKQVQPIEFVLKDFDFKKPSDPLKANHVIQRDHGMARFAVYDYPGEYFEADHADRYVRLRTEEVQARHEVLQGITTARGLAVGNVFTLQKQGRDDQNRKYLLTDLTLTADAGEFASGGSGEQFFSCQFAAVPADIPYRAARLTPKPVIQGIQTATVVGPAGEEIHTDEHARVKVQFHWDRYGKHDENSSCWVRVSQSNAGQGWGSMITPRIGQEVIVEFLEGDPDRPVITGRVYNEEQKPPYAGGKGVVSGLKSNTHKGKGYNEMSMDDTAGKEKITIHAQYDLNTKIEHDETHTVVTGNRTIAVETGTHTETIKGDTTIKITTGKLVHDVVANTADYHVQGALKEKYDNKQETTVAQEIVIKSSGSFILVQASKEITLLVGGSKVWMHNDGRISLEGKNIVIEGSESVNIHGGTVTSKADKNHLITGAEVTSKASSTNSVIGPAGVMLNPL